MPSWRQAFDEFAEGLDWLVGVCLTALGLFVLGAEIIRPDREGLFTFLRLAALAVGAPFLLAAIGFRRRWHRKWILQGLAIIGVPIVFFWSFS